ncbi:hypothetical protein LCGC14_1743790 [marine sediment metagenome]|uniref:Uncharacterized protein n=1 Tax=marine sediment metagenome TaxID=412755 RepID=A0A0F9HTJ4_9ZZZZ
MSKGKAYGWSVRFKVRPHNDCLEAFRCGSLLFRRFSDGWHITGPAKDLEAYADALERELNV